MDELQDISIIYEIRPLNKEKRVKFEDAMSRGESITNMRHYYTYATAVGDVVPGRFVHRHWTGCARNRKPNQLRSVGL